MTPIFKNVDISLDDVREVMQNYAKEHSINPISTGGGGGGVFHPMPSKWLRTPQRNKLAP